jgi:hypothetical protein
MLRVTSPAGTGACDVRLRYQRERTILMQRNPRSRTATAAAFAALLAGTMLAAGIQAANAAPDVHQLPTITRGTVVDRVCQDRTGGMRTCEWLYEWKYKLINGKYTLNVEAYGSMNGSVNKSIVQVQTWARRTPSSPPHEIAVLQGPGGTGYIEGHDGKRLCNGSTAGGLQSRFTYKYWAPKPISAWLTGTAYGTWQYDPAPCNSI